MKQEDLSPGAGGHGDVSGVGVLPLVLDLPGFENLMGQ